MGRMMARAMGTWWARALLLLVVAATVGAGLAACRGTEPGRPGAIRELDLRLRPGHYRLICNMTGHYLGGMNRELTVR